MIMVTGGAGFIGSVLQAALVRRGLNTVVVDRLGTEGKWRNLATHPPSRIIPPEALDAFLQQHPKLEMVFHLGAISATTATDADLTWATNVELSRRLWDWCAAHRVRFVYASSAATYGDGSGGFDDDPNIEALERLRPLNLYGWTKHAFDLAVARTLAASGPRPPQWAGLKFFNVYGPNEYHKGSMISVVKIKHQEVAAGQPPRLFKSDREGLADGAQARDFIWVNDVVDVMLWLLDTPRVNGLFNLGTGRARTYLDLAHAVCDAAGVPRRVEFIDMPAALRGQYQNFTEARMDRLRAAGYEGQFTPLEAGVRQYVRTIPGWTRPLRMTFVYPHIDPVAVQIGPFGIRWYALAYIVSLLLGWRLARRLAGWSPAVATPVQVDDFLTWATLGVVFGGRLGYVLFYQPGLYLAHPLMILQVWHGGMSFHGGLIGVCLAILLYARQQKIPILGFGDRIAVCAPIGLGLGRVANFINGELWGRPAGAWFPFAMIYPQAGPLPRYPSELIEAFLEGVVLLVRHADPGPQPTASCPVRLARRRLPGGLRHLPHHLGVLPPAGCLPRLYRRRSHHGPDPELPDDPHRRRTDLACGAARAAAGADAAKTGRG